MTAKLKVGDTCPVCRGSGTRYMERDAHRSAGTIPCGYYTTRLKKPPGFTRRMKCVDLQCHKGKMVRS